MSISGLNRETYLCSTQANFKVRIMNTMLLLKIGIILHGLSPTWYTRKNLNILKIRKHLIISLAAS